MERATALDQAVYLLLMPAAVRQFRMAPLPSDVRLLLRVLAGDEEARAAAVEASAKPPETIVRASEFYVREILLTPGATDFRALGCEPGAPREELRANMILLMRWLHPDTALGPRDDELFEKVQRAWQTMRSDETRAAYGQTLAGRPMPPRAAGAVQVVKPAANAPALRTNPFLDRATGSRKRRLLKGSIYVVAAALLFMLIAFVLDQYGALGDTDLSMNCSHAPTCEAPNYAADGSAARFGA